MVKTLSKHYLIFTQILNLCFKKMQLYKNYPKHFSTTKIDKHTVCGYSIFIKHAFDTKKSKPDCHRGKDCIKKFCKDLKENAMKIITYEKQKKTTSLTKTA